MESECILRPFVVRYTMMKTAGRAGNLAEDVVLADRVHVFEISATPGILANVQSLERFGRLVRWCGPAAAPRHIA